MARLDGMSSKDEAEALELRKFQQFVDNHVPGGASHMSDSDLANLRDLVDTRRRPEVAQGLIREIDALLEGDDRGLDQHMADNAANGIIFNSPAEVRSWLRQFRAFLASNQAGGSQTDALERGRPESAAQG
jgi:hypothetical protein